MTTPQGQVAPPAGTNELTEVDRTSRKSMRRVGLASFTGTLIEFYDFLIYGFAAALVFSDVFFPALGTAAGTVASFATLGVALVARPLGSIIFGHFGDRLGRKKTLVTTLMMMGGATILVGLMPTADQIGIWAPLLIVVLRIFQGLAAGGEWAGAVNFAAEYAPPGKRGFWTMIPPFGGGCSLALAPAVFAITSASMSDEAFLSYGWRIPFLLSALLVAVGLYVRLKIDETPVFKAEQARSGSSKLPFIEALKNQPRQILLGIGIVVTVPTFSYLGAAYLPNYATTQLGLDRTLVLTLGIVGGVMYAASILAGGVLADRLGRRKTLLWANSLAVVWALILFPFLNIGTALAFGIGLCITLILAGAALGPVGAVLSELFHTRYRYTASGFSYSVAQIIGGAIPPLVGAAIIAAAGSFVFGLFVTALCLLGLISVWLMKETADDDLGEVGSTEAAL
ncbi:MFS transporter [Rhodococcus sp. 06-156-3C]|uniref:MFS transporter n=1 Tax=Nocardiaceae TaxID=85025 RepID=UPI00052309DD|nr:MULTISPECIES: MFS transporter [Rhodococcus]OZD13092.1 MFS transporter [Rhodococcus sp. 06-156-4a]OZD17961.1 MFS transporter [Rhodococcus sp. 06-156-3C]OZD20685.1 MFS transporter [Rhodococcus sp. 06-156-4C]OZD30596.1 MFS transporter [Rhodococcus sp. 06-156-3b]OZD32631.1 MFS transporter [Rhodococcus sp. 06-156-3]